MRIKVIRTLVYEGEEEWITATLNRSLLGKDKKFECSKGRILLTNEERGEVKDEPASG